MSVRALIFDFDGLLLETEWPLFESWRETFARHGVDLTIEEWSASIGTVDQFDPMEELERRTGLLLEREAVQLDRRARRDELIASLPVCSGVREILEEAGSHRLRVAVASSSSLEWVESHLRRLGLDGFFSYLSCFDGSCSAKPYPDLYLRALDALGVPAHHCVAFEDSHNGLLAAKAAQLRCVVVPTPMTRHMDFSLADLVVRDLGGQSLLDLLRTIDGAE